ncbi:hypothetical protein AB0H24_23615 [Streptomyces globisporus]|nr:MULTISPECIES: hypothetical protein [Streptomyces]UIZ13688.1 hypothetical protein LZ559_15345 [Streptomyces sp. R527F]WSF78253.1 hypothetical protein OG838_19930 [Streptomyces globisporus]
MSRLLEAAAPPHPRSSTGNNTRTTGTTRSTSRTRTTRHAPEEPTP